MVIRVNRIGEKRIMNNGMEATIIDYRYADDIDVRFSDGTVVENKSYKSFRNGQIANTSIGRGAAISAKYKSRVGEKRMMNCGMEAEIVAYRKQDDIDVRFSDGTVVTRRNYWNFTQGIISNRRLGRNYTQKRIDRIGEKRRMINGMDATIINYRRANDIDIEFEDGTVIFNKTYDRFSKGLIQKPLEDHKGETREMNNGMKATIVNYRLSNDIDVQFADGTVVENKSYSSFKKGEIANPRLGKFASVTRKYQSRINEERIMNNGIKARIIEYFKHNNITVMFEDDTIVSTTYDRFRKGNVGNPNFIISGESIFEGVILYYLSPSGFKHYKSRDMVELGFARYEVDAFNSETKMGIEVDGPFHTLEKDIRKNERFYKDFGSQLIRIRDKSLPRINGNTSVEFYFDMEKGAFSKEYEETINSVFCTLGLPIEADLSSDREKISRYYYETHSSKRVGKTNMMNCGMEATIVAYRRSDDIDVQFTDGTIIKEKSYKSFKKGEILNPNCTEAVRRIGEKRKMNCGMEATIIAYRNATDIDVQFEDGTIANGREYDRFCKGKIKNHNLIYSKHLGEFNMMNCGMGAAIVKYRRSDDIDVQFEDGTIVKNKSYRSFRKGAIANPNYTDDKKRIGEDRIMNNGLNASIVAYRNSEDIDIQFEDGVLVEHKSYGNFKTGSIRHPFLGQNATITNKHHKARIGEKKMMNCGMQAEIIEYRVYKDIDIRFEDGTVIKHRTYDQFCKGGIMNPNILAKQ